MEDSSSGSRRAPSSSRAPRPDSAASSNTRMTPSSSNNSSANLPVRGQTPTLRGSSGGSLLQERLRERKVRRGSLDFGERNAQSSPVRGPTRDEKRPSSSGKGMGAKSAEEQVSTLIKQNFDLKLELFHRRNKMIKMEEELSESQKQQAETQEMNDQLVGELERRDRALDEAVNVITGLEEKIARLMQDRNDVAAFDDDYFQGDGISSSPPQPAPKRLPRMPSFLSENSEGTEALRSLYAPYHSFSGDLPKLSEEEMDSPRLSVLSESSFVSIYGEKHPEKQLPYLSLDEPEPRRSSDVKKWVEDRREITPVRPRPKGFPSIDQFVTSPLQRIEKLQHKINNQLAINTQPRQKSFDRALPPTPDTFSTNTLRSKRNFTSSTDTLNAKTTDVVPFTDYPNRSHISERPRSAGETITSRREGHGWDTPTETEGSLVSTVDPPYQHLRPRELAPIFSFASNDWGKDAMYNHEPTLPSHRRLRRSSLSEEPRSDDTVKNSTALNRYGDTTYGTSPYGTSPLDTTAQPELPNRRSSLTATMKGRRTQSTQSSNSPSSTSATPGATDIPTPKRSRLPSLGIFKRVEAPNCNSSPGPRPKMTSRESYCEKPTRREMWDGDGASTPPPIRRNRTQPQGYRPSSAGSGAMRERRPMGYEGAGRDVVEEMREKRRERRGSVGPVAPVVVVEEKEGEEEKKGVRKWLGLGGAGRTGSLRR